MLIYRPFYQRERIAPGERSLTAEEMNMVVRVCYTARLH